ncbi:MAG TPA: alpha-ketoglutarate-dependent dioxygenase AlkB [Rhizomicrobium sp.]|nr:alpha-ketoglutarate-dependent dioxygenase AlkB [Rhizomicrobium sp.]
MKQGQLFAGEAEIAGFRYQEELFSPAEEKALVRAFESLPFKPFEFHGYLGNRRVVSFGWRYDYGGAQLRKAETMPQFLSPLREIAAEFAGVEPEEFAHTLVTEYAPGAGIGWHRDKPDFAKVVGLSFCSPCRLRFRRKRGGRWDRRAVDVAPRSDYLLDGEARHIWEHSIAPMPALRYSVTFRTLIADGQAPE